MKKANSTFAALALLAATFTAAARQPAQDAAPPTAPANAAANPPASVKVMRDYRGVKLGMKAEEVRAAMGKAELSQPDKDRFVIKGDDRLTVYYDNGAVKAIHLYIVDPKNAPAWADVVGDAEIIEMEGGAKRARRDVPQEGFWVSMYQSKDGAMTTVTISR
jgi:hypothetical protein